MKIDTIIETNRIIQEIHDSFYSMDGKTDSKVQLNLNRAYDKEYTKLVHIAKDKYGFTRSSNIDVVDPNVIKENEELNDLLNEYAITYPGKKFITDEQITQLCLKYNLILTTPDNFIGKIPEFNLKELNNFNPKGNEKKIFVDFSEDPQFNNLHSLDSNSLESLLSFVATLQKHDLYHNLSRRTMAIVNALIQRVEWTRSGREFNYEESDIISTTLNRKNTFEGTFISSTMVAATHDLLDLNKPGFSINEKNEYVLSTKSFELRENPYPDPLIFHKVKRGAIIITAWGIESQDSAVFNPNIN